MPNPARENRLLDALLDQLNLIGQPPGDWSTAPAIAEGIPGDALPEGVKQQIYVAPVETRMVPEEDDLEATGPVGHQAKTLFGIWCVSGDPDGTRDVLDMKADVLRALFAAEGTLQSQTDGFGMWPANGRLMLEMSRAGFTVWLQPVRAEYTLAHDDP
jgi:hypothetical protein